MLRTIISSIALTAIACGTTPQRAAERVANMGQVILITDATDTLTKSDTIKIGRLHSGEIAILPLRLVNASSSPVVLTSHRTTCGCTTLKYGNQPLMAGDTMRIDLTFDSRGTQGWQFKSVDLILSGRERPRRIFVAADVE